MLEAMIVMVWNNGERVSIFMNSTDIDLANDFLDKNYDEVIAEYKRRNSDIYKAYSEFRVPIAADVAIYLLPLLFLILLYILYKISLPYSILVVTVIGLLSLYTLNKNVVMSRLNILGKPDFKQWAGERFVFYDKFGVMRQPTEPIHSEFAKFIKKTKRMAVFLLVLLAILSTLVFLLSQGKLESGIGFVFFFSASTIVVQNMNLELNFKRGMSERGKKLDEELLSLALEMKK